MFLRTLLLSGLFCIAIGCGAPSPPIAGGKPVDHWLKQAANENPKERVEAIEKLGNIGGKSSDGMKTFIQALDDKDAKVRKVAIIAVVRNRRVCASAFPKLKQMSESDETEEIRKLAAEAHHNVTR